jgi:hypothetical protein
LNNNEAIPGMVPTFTGTHAVMIDPKNGHFGWVFVKHPDGGWVSSRKATEAEFKAAQHQALALTAGAHAFLAPSPAATPGAKWRAEGSPDPHGARFDCERADLCMGDLTDDELANALFVCDHRRSLDSIGYLTAAKDRIRWLSRALEKAQAGGGL